MLLVVKLPINLFILIKINYTYFIIHLGSKHSQPKSSNGANNLLGNDRSKASDTNIDLENGMDHLINPIIDYDDPIFYKQPSDAFVIKNQPATLHCRVSHALDVHFKVFMKSVIKNVIKIIKKYFLC